MSETPPPAYPCTAFVLEERYLRHDTGPGHPERPERLQAVAEPLILCTHAQTPEAIAAPKQLAVATLQPCREMGLALATGLALGIF